MVEAIGLVASVATLSKVSKVAVDILQLLRDAPAEIYQASEELVQLSSQACLIQELQVQSRFSPTHSDDAIVCAFVNSLSYAEKCIDRIATSLRKLIPKWSKRSHIRWILLGREDARRLMFDLNATRGALNLTLSIALCLKLQTAPRNGVFPRTESPSDTIVTIPSTNNETQSIVPSTLNSSPSSSASLYSWSKNIEFPYLSQVMIALVSLIQSERSSTYGLSCLLRLPWSLALTIRLVMRTYHYGRINLSVLRGSSLNLCNFVQQDCEFFVACSKGDLPKMRYMLRHGLARVNDITHFGITPMYLVVKSGSYEAVELLLDEGADVDTLFGINQTSPLAAAISFRHLQVARLLLSYNASCQHITGLGWSPLFYLWVQATDSLIAGPAAEFIQMLAVSVEFRFSHLHILDIRGYGVIHRATIFGQLADVVLLINLGVSPYTQQGPLEWNTIQNAVYFNRHDVFEALLPYFQDYDIDTPDTRGWTLLHISASEGHDGITRHLLKLGADWQALSRPSYSDMAEELYGGGWTPGDVAMGEGGMDDGPRRKELFIQAVRDVKGIDALAVEDIEGLRHLK